MTARTVTGRTDHVVVVGAGLSGLAAALHLRGAGREVTVLESAARPGGRAGRIEQGGYRIDTGPTVLTMPDLADEAFAAVGDALEKRVTLHRLDPAYHASFADGSSLDVHTDAAAMEAAVRDFAGPAEAAGYVRLRSWLEKVYHAEFDRFIGSNIDSPLSLLSTDLVRLAALGGFRRLDPMIRTFLSDERLRRVFTFQALYAGVPPQNALALYSVISYMDTVAGVYFPEGGMHALPQAMADAAVEAGVQVRYGAAVRELERSGGRVAAAITADGQRYGCDAIVLTPDLPVVHELLGRTPRRPLSLRAAPSAVVVHLGVDATALPLNDLAHHTISFGQAWEGTFREIIRDGHLMSDPSLLITRPTATDPSLAPTGKEQLYILAPCPNLDTAPLDWSRIAEGYVQEVVRTVERRLRPGLASAVQVLGVQTPQTWAEQGHLAGTPFSAAHTFSQTGPFRTQNLPRGFDNVVLAGCGTTPGVGVPTVLVSGKLAAARITGDRSTGARRAGS